MVEGVIALPTVAFYTLGCKVNQYDTSAMEELFRRSGYRIVDFAERADVYVINSCSVTARGEGKSRQAVGRAARRNPGAVVALVGCLPQSLPGKAASIEGVDVVVGTADRGRLAELVDEARHRGSGGPLVAVGRPRARRYDEPGPVTLQNRTRPQVKVQEGCSERCSYCIVPRARGPIRSRRPAGVLDEVGRLVGAGHRELVLTGTHLGAYGRDLSPRTDLVGLLERICALPGDFRVRLSSVEPMDVDDALVEAVATWPGLCRHLHLPLQSGSDEVLRLMGRRYTVDGFRHVVRLARGLCPGIGITTDIIVGFPGEGPREFEETRTAVEEMGFSRIHVFRYSARPDTPAAGLPGRVTETEKKERSAAVSRLASKLSLRFNRRLVGTGATVVVEGRRDPKSGLLAGLTTNYVWALFDGSDELKGRAVGVQVTSARPGHVLGGPPRPALIIPTGLEPPPVE